MHPVVLCAHRRGARLLDGDARSGVGRAANVGAGGGTKLFGGEREVDFPPGHAPKFEAK